MDDEDKNENEGRHDDAKSGDGLGDAGKRAIDAERKARKAAEQRAADAEAKVKAAEDADKTEVERLQGQVADLSKKLDGESARADRFEVAVSKGLSLTQARRLVGATKDELEADADELRADLGLDKEPPKDSVKKRPKEDLKSGASNEDDDETVDEDKAKKIAESAMGSGW